MNKSELIHVYLTKKLKGDMDFTQIKAALKENEALSNEEITEIIDEIATQQLLHVKNLRKNMPSRLLFIGFGVVAVIYSFYSILHPTKAGMSDVLSYLCLGGGVYTIFRNVVRLKT